MPSLDLIFSLLMLPAVFLLVASAVVSFIENNANEGSNKRVIENNSFLN
jgi:hypothetical protein